MAEAHELGREQARSNGIALVLGLGALPETRTLRHSTRPTPARSGGADRKATPDRAAFASPRRGGFTAVELVIVMVLLGVSAVTLVPTLSRLATIRRDAAVGQLTAHIRYAQTVAMATRLRTWLVFDAAADTYLGYIENAANLGKANRIALTDPTTRAGLSVAWSSGLYGGVNLTGVSLGTGAELEFDSFGVPRDSTETDLASNGTLTFSDGATVTISAQTGHVTDGT